MSSLLRSLQARFSRTKRLPSGVVLGAVIAPLLIGTGLVSFPAFLGGDSGNKMVGEASDWYTVDRRSFNLSLIAAGELESRNKVEVKCRVGGQTRILELIEEGVRVEKGDQLARLADEELGERLETAQLDLERAKADLTNSEQNLVIKRNEAESNRRAAELKLAMAELELAKWTEGDVPQKKRDLQLKLETAKRNLERYKRDLELSKQLYEEKFISLGELEDDEIRVIEAENALATAKLDFEVYEKYTLPKERRKITSDVEQAKTELERTLRKNESELARAEADLISRQRTLKIRTNRVAEYEEQLKNTVVTAPEDGMVVYATSVGPHWRRRNPLVEGRQVRWDETLFLLPDTNQMVASVRVHEAVLPQVENGQTVNVSIDARPDGVVEAEVISIAVMAEDGGWLNPDLREYIVRAALPKNMDGLKPAMRCSAEIIVGRVKDQLAVPIQAVFAEGDERFVYVQQGNGVTRHPVETGRASETFVEITGGLDTGKRVLLRTPQPFEIVG